MAVKFDVSGSGLPPRSRLKSGTLASPDDLDRLEIAA